VADVGMHRFLQVAASKTKIYMVLEFVDGGELFDKIVSHQKLHRRCLFIFHVETSATCFLTLFFPLPLQL